MDIIKATISLNRLLREVLTLQAARNRHLNLIAEGVVKPSPSGQEQLIQLSAITASLFRQLGLVEVKTVVAEMDKDWAQPPSSFLGPYGNLFERAYGTRALKLMDEIGKATAKPTRMRTTSSQTLTRGGAKPVKASSTRNLVVDHQAYEFKRTIDRRLRFLSSDIRGFLSGDASRDQSRRMCPSCIRWGGDDWTHCPWCGRPLVSQEEA